MGHKMGWFRRWRLRKQLAEEAAYLYGLVQATWEAEWGGIDIDVLGEDDAWRRGIRR